MAHAEPGDGPVARCAAFRDQRFPEIADEDILHVVRIAGISLRVFIIDEIRSGGGENDLRTVAIEGGLHAIGHDGPLARIDTYRVLGKAAIVVDTHHVDADRTAAGSCRIGHVDQSPVNHAHQVVSDRRVDVAVRHISDINTAIGSQRLIRVVEIDRGRKREIVRHGSAGRHADEVGSRVARRIKRIGTGFTIHIAIVQIHLTLGGLGRMDSFRGGNRHCWRGGVAAA